MTRTSDLWERCTSISKALWWILCNSPNLHIILLLCSPLFSMIVAERFLADDYEGTDVTCFRQKPGEMQATEPDCPFNRDFFEAPTHSGWPAIYLLLSFTFMSSLIAHRNDPQRLMQVTFWLHFLITTTIRSFSAFSGWTMQPARSSSIWDFNSPDKICWLWLLVECRCWNWTYLGFYDDYYFDEATRTVHDRNRNPIWRFTSEKTGKPSEDAMYTPYSLMFRPWRDIAVRLSYIHLIGNTIRAIWLRYLHFDAPYTAYMNNSEILTLLLFLSLAVYTHARMRTHIYFDDAATESLSNNKSTVPLPQYSATHDLFAFASPHHPFRTALKSRQIFITSICVMATAAVATWEMHHWIPYFWKIVEYVVVSVAGKVLARSWREYAKMWRTRRFEVQSPEQSSITGEPLLLV
ncbi:hypothetical protein ACET3X_007626 [Alternaria dauci]|uniref:Uncharacterized protein n=1 Tax=Alternaria dauci TaxID=48095 RepID=A0ABR3UCH3_9PLEO